MASGTPKKERQKKTPEQRAAEALGTAERVLASLEERTVKAREAHDALYTETQAAKARLQYVGAHPDLPEADRERIAAMFAPEPAVQDVEDPTDPTP